MAEKIHLEVVTPERLVLSEEVDIVAAPGVLGEFGVLAGHIPFLSTLRPGEVRYTKEGKTRYLAVSQGFAEVQPDKVTILAETAELAREIDVDRAKRARERAEERLRLVKADALEYAQAEAALKRAVARLKVAEKGGRE